MPRPPDDDASLAARARAGSREAAGALVERHWRSCLLVARGVTADRALAEDVAQESLIAALEAIARFDPSRGSFAAWLNRITVNRALNAVRARRRLSPLEEAGELTAPPEQPAGHAAFLDAIAALKPAHRAAVVLRYGLDMSPEEIAAVLDVPTGTVNSRLARALESPSQLDGGPECPLTWRTASARR